MCSTFAKGCLLLSLVVYGFSQTSNKEKHSHPKGSYVVVIDAGSTGSRILTVRIRKDKHGGLHLSKKLIDMTETKPGLSSFADDPCKGRKSIEGLLKRAELFVPKEQRPVTPLVLRATAGLRKLPKDKQKTLLAQVRALLLKSQFNTTIDPAAVMTGSDEGVYDWLSVNFLLNRLNGDPRQMVAAMDMGGASTQVAFPLLGSTRGFSPHQVHDVQLAHQNVTLYSKSYLGLGVVEAKMAVLIKGNQPNSTSLVSACVGLSGGGHDLEYKGVKYHVNGAPRSLPNNSHEDNHSTAGVRVGECRRLVREYVTSFAVAEPRGILNFDIIAFSAFYYITKEAGLLGGGSSCGGVVSMKDLDDAIKRICRGDETQTDPFLCLDLIFIHTLLTDGYGFPMDTKIKVAKNINNYVISWTLGLAYQISLHGTCLS